MFFVQHLLNCSSSSNHMSESDGKCSVHFTQCTSILKDSHISSRVGREGIFSTEEMPWPSICWQAENMYPPCPTTHNRTYLYWCIKLTENRIICGDYGIHGIYRNMRSREFRNGITFPSQNLFLQKNETNNPFYRVVGVYSNNEIGSWLF